MSEKGLGDFSEYVRSVQDANAAASAFVAMLQKNGQLKSHLKVTYRCELRGCVLLQVLATSQGLIFRKPAYRLSPPENARSSSAEGRAKNTRDGDRRWKETCGLLASAENLSVNCDHIRTCIIPNSRIESDVEAQHAKVLVPTGVQSL